MDSTSPHDYRTIRVHTPVAALMVFIAHGCCSRSHRNVPAVVQSL